MLLLVVSAVQVGAQLQVLVGSALVRHRGGPVRRVGGLGQSLAAGRGLGTLVQLGVQGFDDLVFVLQLLAQPRCTQKSDRLDKE